MTYTPPAVPSSLEDPWLVNAPGGDAPGWAMDPTPVAVYRVNGSPGSLTLEEMPNVEPLSIRFQEGPAPSSAGFRYRWGTGISGAPNSSEQALSTAFAGAKAVHAGDMLAVKATAPDPALTSWMFWGHATRFELRLGPDGEDVLISCLGVEARTRDTPVGGMLMRKASDPSAVHDVQTDLHATLNPQGRPNMVPPGANAGDAPNDYPTFLDPTLGGTESPVAQPWDLPSAARYLLFKEGAASQLWVGLDRMPTGSELDALLVAREPNAGATFDPNDGTTWTAKPVACPDMPITGKAWPEALHELIAGRGYGMKWTLGADGGGKPQVSLDVYLLQAGAQEPKDLWLTYGTFDPSQTNLQAADLARDVAEVVTDWQVEGGPVQYEASFVLVAGFPMTSSDGATSAAMKAFDANDASYAGSADKYRLFVLDEAGQGHYAANSATKLTDVPDLSDLLGDPDSDFVVRQREPIGDLFKAAADGQPLKAQLAISKDYAGDVPGLWDPAAAGTWQVVEGGWELLPDRIGVRLTEHNPNSWSIGKPDSTSAPYQGGIVNVIQGLTGNEGQTPFTLRLTCVIEGDKVLRGDTPNPSFAAPVSWSAVRKVDASDRYVKRIRAVCSAFNGTADPVVVRDDTELASAEAYALRAATEVGTLEGAATIPYFTAFYAIGDNIRSIQGRGLGLRTDGGDDTKPSSLPVITAIEWHFEGDSQRTIIHISDNRGVPPGPTQLRPGVREEFNAPTFDFGRGGAERIERFDVPGRV